MCAVWSVKGGVGVTSVAALMAIGHAERAEETLVVDLCGDLPALLGVEHDDHAPGVVDWCATAGAAPDALARLEVEARAGLRFIPRGRGVLGADPAILTAVLASSGRRVIVDCGVVQEPDSFAGRLATSSSPSLMVVRECFLNLRAAQASTLVPTGVVVIKESGRHLGRADVETVTGAPVVAEFAFDSSIARSIDAGLIRARLPRPLLRAVGRVVAGAP